MILHLSELKQRDGHSCGKVATRIVWRMLAVRENGLAEQLNTTPLDGTDPRTIETVLRMSGCRVLAGEMDVSDLRDQTGKGRPVIALMTLHGCGHYVVVGGVERGRVHFVDPVAGWTAMKVADFADHWHDCGLIGERLQCWGVAAWL